MASEDSLAEVSYEVFCFCCFDCEDAVLRGGVDCGEKSRVLLIE